MIYYPLMPCYLLGYSKIKRVLANAPLRERPPGLPLDEFQLLPDEEVPLFYIDKRGCEEEVDDMKCPDTLDEMLLIVRQVRCALPVSRRAAALPSTRLSSSSRTDSADDYNPGCSMRQSSTRTDSGENDAAVTVAHSHRRRRNQAACSSSSSYAEDSNEPLSLPNYSLL